MLSVRKSATRQKGPTASRNKNPQSATTRKKKRVISQAFVSSSEDESGDDSRKRLESVEEEERNERLSGMEEGETSVGQEGGPVAKMQSESSASSSSESESEARWVRVPGFDGSFPRIWLKYLIIFTYFMQLFFFFFFFLLLLLSVSSFESGSENAGSTAEGGSTAEAEQEKEEDSELGDAENGMEASGLVSARIPGSRRLESDSD